MVKHIYSKAPMNQIFGSWLNQNWLFSKYNYHRTFFTHPSWCHWFCLIYNGHKSVLTRSENKKVSKTKAGSESSDPYNCVLWVRAAIQGGHGSWSEVSESPESHQAFISSWCKLRLLRTSKSCQARFRYYKRGKLSQWAHYLIALDLEES